MIPRNKRVLTPVIDILSTFHLTALNEEWRGQVGRQIAFENWLEEMGIKRPGPRRDQRGSGARTYEAWLACLGLIFIEEATGLQRVTLAGERLLAGDLPVKIITDQLMKFQYPSSYSLRRNVNVAERFKVHPFRFILTLLYEGGIQYLTQKELALFVITEAENNSDHFVNHVAKRIKMFRNYGEEILPADFAKRYPARNGIQTFEQTGARLNDIANTFINFLEYTQLAVRDDERKLCIAKPNEVEEILSKPAVFIPRPEEQEYFQRRYGLVEGKEKDTRSFGRGSVSSALIQEQTVRRALLDVATKQLMSAEDSEVVNFLQGKTGCPKELVQKVVDEYRGREAGIFEAEYFRMSLAGREQSDDFEKATAEIFGPKGLEFDSKHVGNRPGHPDVYAVSWQNNYSGIVDNKAYSSYSISNDHFNRMVHNYIPQYKADGILSFYMYIAGGFKSTFSNQVKKIQATAKISGCGIAAPNVIRVLKLYKNSQKISHLDLLRLFTICREITGADIEELEKE